MIATLAIEKTQQPRSRLGSKPDMNMYSSKP